MSDTSITVINPPTINNLINNLNLVQVKTTEIINNFNQMNQINLNQFNQTNIANHFNQVNQQMNVTINLMEKLEDTADDTTDKLGDNLSKLSKWLQMIKSAGSIVLKAAAEEEDFKYRYMVAAQDPEIGEGIYHKFRDQASKKGQNVNDSLKASLGYLPMAQNTGQVEQLNDLTQRLSMLSPDGKSLSDASGAIQSAMNGDNGDLASQFGISESTLSGAGLEGFIQTKDLDGFIQGLQSVLEMQGYTQEAFDTMLDSPLQKWTALVNQFNGILSEVGTKALEVLSPVLDRLNEAMSSGQFSSFIEWISGAFAIIAQVIVFIVDGFVNFATAVQENWDIIAPILTAIAVVLLGNLIIKLGVVIAQFLMLAAANWPILLIIGAITVLIYILQACGFTAGDMVGTIIGYFYMVYEHMKSIFASILNYFMSWAEFVINVFKEPTYAFKKLFADMGLIVLQILYNITKGVEDFAIGFKDQINWIIEGINTVIPYLNKIFGTDWGGIELVSDDNIHSMSEKIKGLMNDLEDSVPENKEDVVKLWRMDASADYKNSFDQGFKKGHDLVANTKNPFSQTSDELPGGFGKDYKPKTPPMPPIPTAPAPTNMNNMSNLNKINNIGQVDKIGDVDGTVDVTSEDLKLMRELAEMQAIQRFVSLTPTVQVTTGDINSGHDVDSIISKITEEMNSQIVSGAQGVYG
ncbi:phage tail tape measure protein [Paenibacillus cucumis (ex Kampfer et al. 2016)]|uniref:Tripartite tricarboxylate transporter TctB family protein n=1 Tax=Paenibacillus cucumis (ex Kampfer et al. 2016) TaxID=1776858 RepID=A0ABS7KFS5_9BACL|nr:tripartite tricarboxylate transporter TctB family protein [Paenibacillus cucumis (ex Kampfer et al. 2016)]MBY0202979.1 tripartite tricarboxylate transporter TctB family protein [Paenibacillus cucumis (ex Kampfer et al. 2016)]